LVREELSENLAAARIEGGHADRESSIVNQWGRQDNPFDDSGSDLASIDD
jgi:hypothetical protein